MLEFASARSSSPLLELEIRSPLFLQEIVFSASPDSENSAKGCCARGEPIHSGGFSDGRQLEDPFLVGDTL
jgi:hypothetical protein